MRLGMRSGDEMRDEVRGRYQGMRSEDEIRG